MVIRKNIAILTVEKLEFPFWVLHYAQNLPQNQTYPSTSKWGRKKKKRNTQIKKCFSQVCYKCYFKGHAIH